VVVADLRTEIVELYDANEHRIRPYIGRAFETAAAGTLRVMTVGINAYLSPADWPNQNPNWFAAWFAESRHRFDRGVATDAEKIARAIAGGSTLFHDLEYRGKEGIFHTNAVKTYLPEAVGKTSEQVSAQELRRHVPIWHAELDVLAKHGVLPHVVLIFGRPFWNVAWQTFHGNYRPRFTHLKVTAFQPANGEALHYANLVHVRHSGGNHRLALLGLRHPSAGARGKANPEWLLTRPDLRRLLELG
jgi:hypothetical protein